MSRKPFLLPGTTGLSDQPIGEVKIRGLPANFWTRTEESEYYQALLALSKIHSAMGPEEYARRQAEEIRRLEAEIKSLEKFPVTENNSPPLPAPKLTPADINSVIVSEQYHILPGTTLTVCCLTLKNGFQVTGISACVDPANFHQTTGQEIARADAVQKIWMLEGYLLKQQLWLESQNPWTRVPIPAPEKISPGPFQQVSRNPAPYWAEPPLSGPVQEYAPPGEGPSGGEQP